MVFSILNLIILGIKQKKEFLNAIKRDIEKNQYALEHQIELIRIPYTMRDKLTLDLILGDQYLVKGVESNGDN